MKMKYGSQQLKTSLSAMRYVNPHSVELPKTCFKHLVQNGRLDGTDTDISLLLNGTRYAALSETRSNQFRVTSQGSMHNP